MITKREALEGFLAHYMSVNPYMSNPITDLGALGAFEAEVIQAFRSFLSGVGLTLCDDPPDHSPSFITALDEQTYDDTELITEPAQNLVKSPEDHNGVKGLVCLHCDKCGTTITAFFKDRQMEFLCKCGNHIDLTVPLAQFESDCPYCERHFYGLTNLETVDIHIKHKCGGIVDLEWNPKVHKYQN